MADYNVGDMRRLTATCTVSGTNTDPTTLTLVVKTPSGTATSYTYSGAQLTKSATGIYYYDLSFTEAGRWKYQWKATGAVKDTTPIQTIQVDPILS